MNHSHRRKPTISEQARGLNGPNKLELRFIGKNKNPIHNYKASIGLWYDAGVN